MMSKPLNQIEYRLMISDVGFSQVLHCAIEALTIWHKICHQLITSAIMLLTSDGKFSIDLHLIFSDSMSFASDSECGSPQSFPLYITLTHCHSPPDITQNIRQFFGITLPYSFLTTIYTSFSSLSTRSSSNTFFYQFKHPIPQLRSSVIDKL